MTVAGIPPEESSETTESEVLIQKATPEESTVSIETKEDVSNEVAETAESNESDHVDDIATSESQAENIVKEQETIELSTSQTVSTVVESATGASGKGDEAVESTKQVVESGDQSTTQIVAGIAPREEVVGEAEVTVTKRETIVKSGTLEGTFISLLYVTII